MEKQKFSIESLLNEPIKLISLVYPMFFIAIVGLGFIYIENNEQIARNNLKPIGPDTTKIISELTIQEPRIASAIDMSQISAPSSEVLEKGKSLYTNICSSCHGTEGKGDGVAGVALNPKPRNFSDEIGWKNGRTFSEMYNTLEKGIAANGMPSYDYMDVAERVAILQYVRKNLMINPQIDSQEELANLDKTYSLSAGKKIAGTVPVNAASELLLLESAKKSELIEKVYTNINQLKQSDNSAELFCSLTSDLKKAVETIINSTNSLKSEKDFLLTLTAQPLANGFKSTVYNLSDVQVRQIFSFVKSVAI